MAKMRFNPRLRDRLKRFIIVASVVFGLVLVQPFLWSAVRRVSDHLHEDRSKLRQIAEIEKRIEDIQRDRDDQDVLLEQLTAVVPEDKDTLHVLERLEGVAQQLGVALEVSSIEEEESLGAGETPAVEIAVELAVEPAVAPAVEPAVALVASGRRVFPLVVTVSAVGPVTQLLAYIDAIEHIQELMQIRSLVLGSEGMTAEIVFYFQERSDG